MWRFCHKREAGGGGRQRVEHTLRLPRSVTRELEPDRAGLTRSGVATRRHGRSQGLMGYLNIETCTS